MLAGGMTGRTVVVHNCECWGCNSVRYFTVLFGPPCSVLYATADDGVLAQFGQSTQLYRSRPTQDWRCAAFDDPQVRQLYGNNLTPLLHGRVNYHNPPRPATFCRQTDQRVSEHGFLFRQEKVVSNSLNRPMSLPSAKCLEQTNIFICTIQLAQFTTLT